MAYDKAISKKKGMEGTAEGVIIGAITIGIIGLLKLYIKDMDQATENTVAGVIGTIVSGAILGISRFVRNKMKHQNAPAPKPVESAKPAGEKAE